VFSILIHGLLAAAVIAPGPDAPASSLRQDDLRIASITYRMATTARHLCPEPRPISGLLLHHLADYTSSDRPGMISRYGLDRGAGVLSVVENSPAARAGLRAGDVIMSVAGLALALPAEASRADRDALEDRFEDALRIGRSSFASCAPDRTWASARTRIGLPFPRAPCAVRPGERLCDAAPCRAHHSDPERDSQR
jgi:hypothetical protein